MKYIQRTYYLDKLDALQKVPLIITLVGMRRVGKSVLLKQFSERVGKEQCLLIDKENSTFRHIMTGEDLEQYVDTHIGSKSHLLIDEIQYIAGWDKAILSIFSRYGKELNIIITGSNSSLLSHEIGTMLRGRTIDIKVYPFSFMEYQKYFSDRENTLQEQFISYMEQGGLPSAYVLPTGFASEWINNLINTVFLQDVVERKKIKEVGVLRHLYEYLVDNVGNVLSISKLVHTIQKRGITVSYNTVLSYIDSMIESLLLHQVFFYDIKGKKIFERQSKIYSFDHNTKYVRNSGYDVGYGKYLENYIYISLLYYGWEVYIGKIGAKEIDFIAERGGKKIYIQVCYMLTDEKVIEREFGNLESIDDNYPKYVVSMDPISLGNRNGIEHIQARNRDNYVA